jgi:hypothetical protein
LHIHGGVFFCGICVCTLLQITGEFECNFCNASFLPPPSHLGLTEHLSMIQNHHGSLSWNDVLEIAAVTRKGLYLLGTSFADGCVVFRFLLSPHMVTNNIGDKV